jgi:hypothetical protein
MSRSIKFTSSPAWNGCAWKRKVMLVVFQFTTMLMSENSAMQLNSVSPSCVKAPPFCVVRLVRLFVN